MESYSLYFELKELPPSLNVLLAKGWRFRANAFKKIKTLCHYEIRNKIPTTPLTKFKITFTRHTMRPLDIDNLAASFKPVLDALVISKVILDDAWTMTENVFYRQVRAKNKASQKIVVEVSEL